MFANFIISIILQYLIISCKIDTGFQSKTVPALQNYLKERGFAITNKRKCALVELSKAAQDFRLPLDPDGLFEN